MELSVLDDLDTKERVFSSNVVVIGPLRFLEPYEFVFKCRSKGRWYNRTLKDVFLSEFQYMDENMIDDRVKSGKLLVNGKKVGIDYVIQEHDFIENTSIRKESPIFNVPVKRIGETDDFIAFFKPSSMPVHATGGYFYNSMVKQVEKRYFPVHRLDKVTSGIVIMAKNKEAAHRFRLQMIEEKIHKTYVARVKGVFPSEEVIVDKSIQDSSEYRAKRETGEDGKESKTIFKLIKTNGNESIVECHPLTGRTHQIRVHLAHIGFPISNDSTYNGNPISLNHDIVSSINIALERGLIANDVEEQFKTNQYAFEIWLCSIKYECDEFCFEVDLPEWTKI